MNTRDKRQGWGEATMIVCANDLNVGDALRLNDWNLHVISVQHGPRATVGTAEFDFFLHFDAQDRLDVLRTPQQNSAGA